MTHGSILSVETRDQARADARDARVQGRCEWCEFCMETSSGDVLPNGCTRERAVVVLAMYDMRREGGYHNQVIAARERLKFSTGMGVSELRRWLADNSVTEGG